MTSGYGKEQMEGTMFCHGKLVFYLLVEEHVCRCLQRPEEGVRSLGDEVTGGC